MQYCITYTFFLTIYDIGKHRVDLMADVAVSPFFEAESLEKAVQAAKSYDSAGNAVVLYYNPTQNCLWAKLDSTRFPNSRLQDIISIRPFSYNMESCSEQDLTEIECLEILDKYCNMSKVGNIRRFTAPISYGPNLVETVKGFAIQQKGI